jgi:hypothetical protein
VSTAHIVDQPMPPAVVLAVSAGDVARWAVIVVAIVVTGALIVWFATTRRHPESTADHAASERITARKPDGVARRPAGPAAENMNPEPSGGAAPPAQWPGSSAVPPDASGAPD